jgi:hypothetical protein
MIGGIGSKMKEIGSFHNFICPFCGRLTRLIIYKRYDYFHLFFILLFRWNLSYLAQSTCCDGWLSLPFEKGRSFEKNPDLLLSSKDFTPLSNSFVPKPQCPYCRHTVQEGYHYCPYCGKQL